MDIRESFEIYFELVEDPRSQAHITYKLSDILFMLVTGMLCSCTDLEMIIEFAEEKLDFLKKYTKLKEIPCLSTLSNILKVINPDHLELCLYGIFSNVLKLKMKIDEKQICIDGKTICSTATMKEHERPMHIFKKSFKNSGLLFIFSKNDILLPPCNLLAIVYIFNKI